jgi:translation initiation factor IF-2
MKAPVVVRDLASAMHRKPFQVIADLMELKVIANVNQAVDEDIARQVCAKHGFRFEIEKRERGGGVVKSENPKRQELDPDDAPETLITRPPVVTIMGHVDHGKTTLLDTIRKTNVVAKEAGGITQHIGAYTIEIPDPENKKGLKPITFLDTPGHAAFSAMRARGANVTDIVVLVVAASEGVLPQTVEALSHAKAAGVPIIVAVNKCDHPNANPTRIRQQMQERDQLCEEWGGSTIFQDVSALTGENVDKLLELILLQAEILELKANPKRRAVGNIIESGVEAGGPTATFLVRKGTLKVGDVILCDNFYGKARALIDESGARVKEVGPSTAVKVLGLNGAPDAGAQFIVVESDKLARQYAEETHQEIRLVETERKNRVTLENLFQTLDAGSAKMLKVVVKADTQGSVEAIVEALSKIHSDKVSLTVIHDAVGTISESDVLLCSASNAIILGFHTRLDKGVPETAKREGVQIKTYAIIYELIEEVKQAMAGLLDPIHREVTTGAAEIRQVFSISKSSNVAGCMVSSGKMTRGRARLVRKENTIYTGMIGSLRRFQDEVNEVRAGMECGIRIDGFDQFEEGDIIECFALEEIAQEL